MNSETKPLISLVMIIAGSLLFSCVPVFRLLSFAYQTGEQSYILLVPAVCFGLIYSNRGRILAKQAFGLSRFSIAVLGIGGLLAGVAYLLPSGSELQLIDTALGLVLFWIGGFTLCFGITSTREASFELAMLLWIVPIPVAVIDSLTLFLQSKSADLVDLLFQITRVPMFRSGFYFYLPGQAIEVAKQCSGIRSTLSLLFLTLILAHESLHHNWKRLVLVLCAFPIVILKNGVRIVTLTLLAIYIDPSFLTGPLHHDGGILFFLLGLAMLMPILALLRRGEKPQVIDAENNSITVSKYVRVR